MDKFYSDERNVQILIALLKAHNIRKIIASPGTTNLSFVASMQQDPYFEIYSSVDERSAAYIACGLAAESGEPVVITCTGATASRNYLSGLTEAYYRKLPVLAVTATQYEERVGHLHAQLIDRSSIPNDIAKLSIQIPSIKNDDEIWACEVKINKALLELRHHGGGPVHINLQTIYSRNFSVTDLPRVNVIRRFGYDDLMPEMPEGRIGIFVGSHATFTPELTQVIDEFCASRDAVVFCDHSSGYYGKYRVHFSLVAYQSYSTPLRNLDILIHIGEVSGEYACLNGLNKKTVWRISEDGEIRDTFRKLHYVFEMSERHFFKHYTLNNVNQRDKYLNDCIDEYKNILAQMPEIPFSNVWVASRLSQVMPKDSVVHLGILNSLRSWNLFEFPPSVSSFSNVGGFGIDGCISSMIGASLVNRKKLYFCIIGDLGFFYDMNVIGNRHVGNNVRILLVNNGKGTEFRNFYHTGSLFGDDADKYIAAAGHFGNKSSNLVKHYAEDLGYEYLSASNKEEFLSVQNRFVTPEVTERPIVFEIFTDSADESDAMKAMWGIKSDLKGTIVKKSLDAVGGKAMAKKILGEKGTKLVKKVFG